MDVATVIPAYNPPADYFAALLDSLAAQTVPPAEVVIVDDGATVPVMAPFPIVRQDNSGVVEARNRGIRETSAPLVHVLDQDELLEPSFYQRLIPAFDDPAVVVAFATMRARVGDTPADWTIPPPGSAVPDTATLIRQNLIGSSGAIFRRSLWEQLGGFADYPTVHDWHFWIRASQVGRLHHVAEPLAWHRRHDAQTTRDSQLPSWLREEIVMLRALDIPPSLRRVRRQGVAHRWLRLAELERDRRRRDAVRALPVFPRSALSVMVRQA